MRDLQWYGEQMLKELEAIDLYNDIPVTFKVSNRMSKTWGHCHVWWKTVSGVREYTRAEITIASFLLDDEAPEFLLRNTLLHEGAHLIDKNQHGHRGYWLELADLISDCYAMDITQYVNDKEKQLIKGCEAYERKQQARMDSKDRWEFTCLKCGRVYKRARKPKYLTDWGYDSETMVVHGAVCGGGCKGELMITKYPNNGLRNVKKKNYFYL